MELEDYYKLVTPEKAEMTKPIFEYIQTHYPDSIYDDNYAPKTKFPMYRYNGSYVAVACMKHYLSIHFGSYGAVQLITSQTPYVRGNVGCVNCTYKRTLPYELIFQAIDYCFKLTEEERTALEPQEVE